MIRKAIYNGRIIEYNLQRKNVKNINLRIKPDLTVTVSANKLVSQKYIDDFIIRKGEFILSALDRFKNCNSDVYIPNFSDEEFTAVINSCFENVYALFKNNIRSKPILNMRTMKSSWGTCNYVKYVITLNTNLIYCTEEQIFYVIVHEFAHLLVPEHSKKFYSIVEKYCENYKEIRKEMKNINLKRG